MTPTIKTTKIRLRYGLKFRESFVEEMLQHDSNNNMISDLVNGLGEGLVSCCSGDSSDQDQSLSR